MTEFPRGDDIESPEGRKAEASRIAAKEQDLMGHRLASGLMAAMMILSFLLIIMVFVQAAHMDGHGNAKEALKDIENYKALVRACVKDAPTSDLALECVIEQED